MRRFAWLTSGLDLVVRKMEFSARERESSVVENECDGGKLAWQRDKSMQKDDS